MKKIKLILSTLTLCMGLTSAYAQYSITAVSGMHLSNIKSNGIDISFLDYDPILRWHAGLIGERALSENIALQSGLIYRNEGFVIRESTNLDVFGIPIPVGASVTAELKSISVPLRLKYMMSSSSNINPYVAGGFNLSYTTNGRLDTRAESIFDFNIASIDMELSSSAYNRFGAEAVIAGGLQIETANNAFYTIEANFSHDLNDFTNANSTIIDAGIRNYNIGLSVGYGLRF